MHVISTLAKLLMDAERSTCKPDVLRRLDTLARVVPVRYGMPREICEYYAQQFTRLRAIETPIGANNLWIAGHALADDRTLVTTSTREFEWMAGVKVGKLS